MSDGPSDCAYRAKRLAREFVKNKFPGIKEVMHHTRVPKMGKFVYIYEEWLDHIVELIEDRKLLRRWKVPPFSEITEMTITDKNWQIGALR